MELVKQKKPILNLEKLYLRPLHQRDLENTCNWMNDPYVIAHSFVVPGLSSIPPDFYTKSYAVRYFDLLLHDPTRHTFAIINNEEHIGNVGFKDIKNQSGFAECFIEIGAINQRGKGAGFLAMRHLIDYGFLHLSLKIIELEVLEFNTAAIKIYQKLGFQTLPTYSWHYDEFGIFWKVLRMRLKK